MAAEQDAHSCEPSMLSGVSQSGERYRNLSVTKTGHKIKFKGQLTCKAVNLKLSTRSYWKSQTNIHTNFFESNSDHDPYQSKTMGLICDPPQENR